MKLTLWWRTFSIALFLVTTPFATAAPKPDLPKAFQLEARGDNLDAAKLLIPCSESNSGLSSKAHEDCLYAGERNAALAFEYLRKTVDEDVVLRTLK